MNGISDPMEGKGPLAPFPSTEAATESRGPTVHKGVLTKPEPAF